MAKTQPKVTELVEILLQQVAVLEKSVNQNSQTQIQLSKKMDNSFKVDVSVLKSTQKAIKEDLKTDFEIFHEQINKNNQELLKMHKNVSSKRLFYIILLNILLLLTTGISVYIAIKKSINQNNYELMINENSALKNEIKTFELFFLKNPEVVKKYKKWNRDVPK
ncbi:hypothetical protein ACSV4D_11045 [Flavobacterium sp. ARAG 55.4]|uniref:hypothetical protein n=1 Tax=Flavobacterium sp. ARAG 55.4 TaxID=3451357 RepID=UPI003F462AA9